MALLAAASLALVSLPGIATHFWKPPPPEFADTTDASDLLAPMHTWEPTHGGPDGLLDRLPPGGPAVADVNGDELPDVFVPAPGYADDDRVDRRNPRARLFLNEGSTKTSEAFVDVTDVAGLDVGGRTYAGSWGDVDDDGWPDLLVGGYGTARLLRHDGNMTFSDVTAEAGIPQDGLVTGAAWGDVDADGDLDLFLARYTPVDGDQPDGDLDEVPGTENALLRNDGGTFQEVPLPDPARRSTSASLVDVDDDGHLDVHVTNYRQPNTYWRNQGDGTFAEGAAAAGLADAGPSTCQAWGDVDRDGRRDLLLSNGPDGPALHLQTSPGTYQDRTSALNLTAPDATPTWGCDLADIGNDGDLDAVLARSNLAGDEEAVPLVYTNSYHADGQAGFTLASGEAGDGDRTVSDQDGTVAEPRAASGLVLADLNVGDQGAQDVLTTTHHRDRLRIYRSIGWSGGWSGGNGAWLRVSLEGTDGNALGLGATVTVDAGDLHLVRQVGADGNWGADGLTHLIFGLYKPYEAGYQRSGDVSVTVEWPDGTVQAYGAVWDVGSSVHVTQDQGYRNDSMPPRTFLTPLEGTPGEAGWYTSSPVTLEITARDELRAGNQPSGVASLAYSLDGRTWTSADPDGGATVTFQEEGTHRLWVRAADEAGNEHVTLHPVRVDTQAPQGRVDHPRPGAVYAQGQAVAQAPGVDDAPATVLAPRQVQATGTPVDNPGWQPVTAEAADDQGVGAVEYQLLRRDGQPVPGFAAEAYLGDHLWTLPAADLPPDLYRLQATVEDRAGNAVDRSRTVAIAPTSQAGLRAALPAGADPFPALSLADDPLLPDLPTEDPRP